jgi:tRNA nucleotidyltransferase (CCA-adding enzyme)
MILVTGHYKNIDVDIVNLRSETYTHASRVPVIEPATPQGDAARRDLTINALFYNLHTKEVEDFTTLGMADISNSLIRTPLDPVETLLDDPLRALRAVRFASRFHFHLHHDLVKACKDPRVHNQLNTKISPERCASELKNMISGPQPVLAAAAV